MGYYIAKRFAAEGGEVLITGRDEVKTATAAKEIGINKAAVSNWKYRKNGPSDVTMQKIADYFGVSLDYLMGRTDVREINRGQP